MKIISIDFVEVVVPARPDAINSPSLDKPLHKMTKGASAAWSMQFDELPKQIMIARCDDGTVGIGESLRDPDPVVLRTIAEALIGVDVEKIPWQRLPWPKIREYDGFECLLLDLLGKRFGVPVSALLGGALRETVHVGAWSGHRTPADAGRLGRAALDRGMDCLKLKCELEDDVVAIAAAVHRECGNELQLIFDPNERFEELRHAVRICQGLEEFGNVLCLEDPLPRWDLNAYAELRRKTSVPIAMHVALGYTAHGQRLEDVASAFRAGAADVFNFSSGIADFLRMGHTADAIHAPYWHGSEIELGILEAAYVHAASASAGCTLPSDIFGRGIREHDLLAAPLQFDGTAVSVPMGPGLGVALDEEALARYEVARFTIHA